MKDSREHILVTSLNLFLQKSFKEVTMKEIVEKTGLSKGAFYHYFSSKEQVFEEVITHFYADLFNTDYNELPHASLKEFYENWLKAKVEKLRLLKEKTHGTASAGKFTSNQYFLLFDAMRMLPDFKKLRFQQRENEENAWTRVIEAAINNGEISTSMSADRVAKLFTYAAKGVGIDSVMTEHFENSQVEIKALWDELYQLFKTK